MILHKKKLLFPMKTYVYGLNLTQAKKKIFPLNKNKAIKDGGFSKMSSYYERGNSRALRIKEILEDI